MIQLATFELPAQEKEANDFLRTHKPAGPINFNEDRAFVFYDDGSYPAEYEIANLQELIDAQREARVQQEVALHTLEFELADYIDEKSNTPTNLMRYDQIAKLIKDTETGIETVRKALLKQDSKTAFVQAKIDALRATT